MDTGTDHRRRLPAAARLIRAIWPLALLALLAGCSSALRWSPDTHVVRDGDTLFSIARRYDLDPRDLAAWNRLGDGRLIYPGQRLTLTGPAGAGTRAPARTASRPKVAAARPPPVRAVDGWRWPTAGKLAAGFGSTPSTQSGIEIGGRFGQVVSAAADGEIVYAGSGLKSYGQLLIIKHNESFLSAYGHNDTLLVREGERVVAGQQIARMGNGPGKKPLLHFEIRRNGSPVDPLGYLPGR
jgi:lipoprotein NlpD